MDADQCGAAALTLDGRPHLAEWFGRAVSLDAYRQPPGLVAELLSRAGLDVRARMLHQPDGGSRGCAADVPAGPKTGRPDGDRRS